MVEVDVLPSDNHEIREITDDDLDESVEIIRRAFGTVAADLGLTKQNCPTHPSFITYEQLAQLRLKGLRFFGLYVNKQQIGFVAVEKANDSLYYMEKLGCCRSTDIRVMVANWWNSLSTM
jgi:diamine N-acetyltransferase